MCIQFWCGPVNMVRTIWRLAMGLAPDVCPRKSCGISYNRRMKIWRTWERKQNKKHKLHNKQKVDQDQKIQLKIERQNDLDEPLAEASAVDGGGDRERSALLVQEALASRDAAQKFCVHTFASAAVRSMSVSATPTKTP